MGENLLMMAARALPWAVILCGLVVAVVIVDRWIVVGKKRVDVGLLVARIRSVVRRGEPSELLAFCGQKQSPVINTLRRFASLRTTNGASQALLLERAAREELHLLERRLHLLATIGGVTPLLGLSTLLVLLVNLVLPGSVPKGLLDAASALPPLSIAALALGIGIVAILGYNLLSLRIHLLAHDLEQFSWELLPLLDQLAHPSVMVTQSAADEPKTSEEDEFFRKKV